jgi:WD40 repeat protein
MRRPRSLALLGLGIPAILLSLNAAGCNLLPSGPGGGGGGVFNLPPTVVISVVPSPPRGVAPLTVQFNSADSVDDGIIVERLWDFGDGTTSPEISPVKIYQTNGEYEVTLTLTDDQGASSSRDLTVTVTDRPVAVIEVDREGAANAPAAFTFDGSASFDPDAVEGDELTYLWDFDDGTREDLPIVEHTFATPGEYRVVLTVIDAAGVQGTAEKIIVVGIPQPTVAFRSPPNELANLMLAPASPLWTQIDFTVTPDVPYRISAGFDGDSDSCGPQTNVFDLTNGEFRFAFTGHDGPVTALALSPDGTQVLTGSADGTVRLHDAASGSPLRVYTVGAPARINGLAFAPSGTEFVAVAEDGTIRLRDVNSNDIVRTFGPQPSPVNAVAFAPGGSQILTGNQAGLVVLWFVPNAQELGQLQHPAAVTDVAFSPTNPDSVATACADGLPRTWNTNSNFVQEFAPTFENGEQVTGHVGPVNSIAFGPNGLQLLTAGDDQTARIWDITTASEVRVVTGHTAAVNDAAFSSDGGLILTASDDTTARLTNTADGALIHVLEQCASPLPAAIFSADDSAAFCAVAARGDVVLDPDATDGVLQVDLNLSLPTALDVRNVPPGEDYRFWVEIWTDRTEPERVYSPVPIDVVADYTFTITPDTPLVPLDTADSGLEQTNIIARQVNGRQVVDLGPLATGDRLKLRLLALPGYFETFQLDGFSVTLLDANEELYAAFQDESILFTSETDLVIGHDSDHYYVVLDSVDNELIPSVQIEIERDVFSDSQPLARTVYLDYNGTGSEFIALAGSDAFRIPALEIGGFDTATLRNETTNRLNTLFAAYDITFATGDTPPAQPYTTIWFDPSDAMLLAIPDANNDGVINADDLRMYGLVDFVNPRNRTQIGRAAVSARLITTDFPGLATEADLGRALGNAAGHQLGLMLGLRPTANDADDLMTQDSTQVGSASLTLKQADLAPIEPGKTSIGTQDSPQYLSELVGP